MKRRDRVVWGWALVVATTVAGLLFVVPETKPGASALSARPDGWLAARRYLEARGTSVRLDDLPLDRDAERRAAEPPAVLVLAFPWQRLASAGELEALNAYLRGGGTVLVAYSRSLRQLAEQRVLETLGLDRRTVRDPPPLAPWKWWAYQRQTWVLEPGAGWSGAAQAPRVVLGATATVPQAPAAPSVLYSWRKEDTDVPLIFSYSWQRRGRVVALPAAVLSNAHLLEAGHADFLESLGRWLGDTWSFDEYHHGLVSPELAQERGSTFAWDLFMIHLLVFYVLGLLALARRFGPPWRETAPVFGSTSSFLRNLGSLHRELGHHAAAARLLVERLRELDPSLPEIRLPEVRSDARLVELAHTLTPGSRSGGRGAVDARESTIHT